MPKDSFTFRRFTIRQDRCAMKVGTDGTMLGAWARGGSNILDIGSGTGLISLMMAQRNPGAQVVGVEIDSHAVEQATENAQASPFSSQVSFVCADITRWRSKHKFDAIVSNPPFFVQSLENPDRQRAVARHTTSLTYRGLIEAALRLLSDDGELSLVIPFDCKDRLLSEAMLAGLFLVRECGVRTTPRKPPRRFLLSFRKHPCKTPAGEWMIQKTEEVIEDSPGCRSSWYSRLTSDFYL